MSQSVSPSGAPFTPPSAGYAPPAAGYAPPSQGYTPPSGGRSVVGSYATAKSRLLALVLALFLGTFGVHKLYLGYREKGRLRLVLGCVSFVAYAIFAPMASTSAIAWPLTIVSGIVYMVMTFWAVADFFKLLLRRDRLDAAGVPLR